MINGIIYRGDIDIMDTKYSYEILIYKFDIIIELDKRIKFLFFRE